MQGTDCTSLIRALSAIVGAKHVLTGDKEKRSFTDGYRYGGGPALAVVRPATPLEQFQAFSTCVAAGTIVIVQAANTGLTGGSTPCGTYDRPVVIINTMRIKGIHLLAGGEQVVCLAGATLFELEKTLAPIGREPHSVIGSSCIGASVVGGICNSSGGALTRRGPAYTELALFARVAANGQVELVNHLGIDLGTDEIAALKKVAMGDFQPEQVSHGCGAASTPGYDAHLRSIEADTPARYNADLTRLFEASGCAGRLMVLAVRLDTFPRDKKTKTYYIGTNDPNELVKLRQRGLSELRYLPVSGEYIHGEAFDIAATYGKDSFLFIEWFGTDRVPFFFQLKARIDRLSRKLRWLPSEFSDRLLQFLSRLIPQHLPMRIRQWRRRYEHHLILKVADDGIDEMRGLLRSIFPSLEGDFFECTAREERKAFLHRFVVAGAAMRYRAIHSAKTAEIISLDVALRRNDRNWHESLPLEIARNFQKELYYGHFFVTFSIKTSSLRQM